MVKKDPASDVRTLHEVQLKPVEPDVLRRRADKYVFLYSRQNESC